MYGLDLNRKAKTEMHQNIQKLIGFLSICKPVIILVLAKSVQSFLLFRSITIVL